MKFILESNYLSIHNERILFVSEIDFGTVDANFSLFI